MNNQWQQMYQAPSASAGSGEPAYPGGGGWTGTPSIMDAYRFVTSQRDWVMNGVLAVVFAIIPLVGPISLEAWLAEFGQRLVRRHPQPLPKLDFNDFTHYMSRGFSIFVANLLLGLIVAIPMVMLYVASVAAIFVGGAALKGPGAAIMMGLVVLIAPFVIMPLTLFVQFARWRVELTEQIGDAFQVGKTWQFMRAMWWPALKGLLVFALCTMVVMCIPLINYFVIIGVGNLVLTHFRWQLYEAYVAGGGEPIPVKGPVQIPSEAKLAAAAYYRQQPPPY